MHIYFVGGIEYEDSMHNYMHLMGNLMQNSMKIQCKFNSICELSHGKLYAFVISPKSVYIYYISALNIYIYI